MVPEATSPRARRRRLAAATSVAVLAAAAASAGTYGCGQVKTSHDTAAVAKSEDFVAGEIIVWFDDELGAAAVDELVARTGGEIIERSSVTPSRVVISVPAGEEDRYVDAYRKLKEVRAAGKNYKVRALRAEGGGAGEYKIEGE